MGGRVERNACARDIERGQPRDECIDRVTGTRHDAFVVGVDGGQRDGAIEHRDQLVFGHGHGEHRRVGTARSAHQASASNHEPHRVFEGEDVGQQGRHVFTEAVSDYGVGFDAERHPLARERHFGHEHGSQRRHRIA